MTPRNVFSVIAAMAAFAPALWAQAPTPATPQTQTAAASDSSAAVPEGGQPEHIAFFKRIAPQFVALSPAASTKTITFTESSDGLPQTGSWRNTLAVADMNGDGFPDIIAPPARKGNGTPVIFLGDGKGHWK